MIELHACPRVALLRREQDREHTPVPPHVFALLHWPLPPLWGFRIFATYPVHLSFNLFCSACASMLRSHPQIPVPLVFRRGCHYCPGFGGIEKRSFMNTFRLVPCYSATASSGCKSFVLCSFLKSGSARIALMRFTLLINSSRWTLSFPNFDVMPSSLGEFYIAICSQFYPFRGIDFLGR